MSLSRDGRWLLVHLSLGWSRVDVHLVDRRHGRAHRADRGHRGRVVASASWATRSSGSRRSTPTAAGSSRRRSSRRGTTTGARSCPRPTRVIEAVVPTADSLLVLSSQSAVSHLDRYDHDGTGTESDRPPRARLARRACRPAAIATRPSSRSPRSPARRRMFRWTPGGSPPTGAGSVEYDDDERRAHGRRTSSTRCATRRPTAPRSPCS